MIVSPFRNQPASLICLPQGALLLLVCWVVLSKAQGRRLGTDSWVQLTPWYPGVVAVHLLWILSNCKQSSSYLTGVLSYISDREVRHKPLTFPGFLPCCFVLFLVMCAVWVRSDTSSKCVDALCSLLHPFLLFHDVLQIQPAIHWRTDTQKVMSCLSMVLYYVQNMEPVYCMWQ